MLFRLPKSCCCHPHSMAWQSSLLGPPLKSASLSLPGVWAPDSALGSLLYSGLLCAAMCHKFMILVKMLAVSAVNGSRSGTICGYVGRDRTPLRQHSSEPAPFPLSHSLSWLLRLLHYVAFVSGAHYMTPRVICKPKKMPFKSR